MNSSFHCGGKIFILGEYACLVGLKALVLSNQPEFRLTTSFKKNSDQSFPFAEASPAGLYYFNMLKKHPALSEIVFQWFDPYSTPIGVGSSSAQFILTVYACCEFLKNPRPQSEELLALYWDTVGESQGLRPSGIDVLVQASGGVFAYSNEPYFAEKLNNAEFWSERFLLAYTGSKAKTHEHLLQLQKKGWPEKYTETLSLLNLITLEGINAWKAKDERKLGSLLLQFQKVLIHREIASQEAAPLFDELSKWNGVYGCKGSGAQGGDCILFLIDPVYKKSVQSLIESKGWIPYSVTINELEISE